jgi:hypothetical protein
MIRLRQALQSLLVLMILVACQTAPVDPNPSPTESPPSQVPSPTRAYTVTPDPAGTAEAERVKATFQAYQTQTASEKATERAGGQTPSESPTHDSTSSPAALLLLDLALSGRLIDPATAAGLEQLVEIPTRELQAIVFQTEGSVLFAANESYVQWLDLAAPDDPPSLEALQGPPPHVLALSPNGEWAAAIDALGMPQLWRRTSQALVPIAFEKPPQVAVEASWLTFSPDSQELAAFFPQAAAMAIWSLPDNQTTVEAGLILTWNREVVDAALNATWQEIAWQFESTLVRTDREQNLLLPALAFFGQLTSFGYVGEPESLMASSRESAAGQDWLQWLVLGDGGEPFELAGTGELLSWLMLPGSARLVYATTAGLILETDLNGGPPLTLIESGEQYIGLQASPDGRLIAAQTQSGFQLLGSQSGQLLFQFPATPRGRLTFFDSGRLIAIESAGQSFTLWAVP